MVTSMPDAPEPAAAPQELRLDGISAQVEALDMLLAMAKHSVRVFDTHMADMGWNSTRRIDALAAFLRGSSDAHLQVIVHDTHRLESACPRLLAMLQRWSAAITIYRTGAEARHAMDPLVIVDGLHTLHRFHADQPRAALVLHDPTRARALVRRFEEIWATGEPGIDATVLGL